MPAEGGRISGYDFRAWDKFDVDAALEAVDQGADDDGGRASDARKKEADAKTRGLTTIPPVRGSTAASPAASSAPTTSRPHFPSATVAQVFHSQHERETAALHEKDKGNESFRANDFDEAAVYYSRSLSIQPAIPVFNNRALALVKLNRFTEALSDCNRVLQAESQNIKGLVRRAMALQGLSRLEEALADAQTVLQLQPESASAKKLEADIKKALGAKPPVQPVDVGAKPPGKPVDVGAKPTTRKTRLIIADNEEEIHAEEIFDEVPPKAATPVTAVRGAPSTVTPIAPVTTTPAQPTTAAAAAAAAASSLAPKETGPTTSMAPTTTPASGSSGHTGPVRRMVVEEDSDDESLSTAAPPLTRTTPEPSRATVQPPSVSSIDQAVPATGAATRPIAKDVVGSDVTTFETGKPPLELIEASNVGTQRDAGTVQSQSRAMATTPPPSNAPSCSVPGSSPIALGSSLASAPVTPAVSASKGSSVQTCPAAVTPTEFMRALTRLHGSPAGLATYLSTVPAKAIPKLFGTSLEADHVIDFLLAMESCSMEATAAFALLQSLSRAPRFSMVLLFLADNDRALAARVFTSLAADIPADVLRPLERLYTTAAS